MTTLPTMQSAPPGVRAWIVETILCLAPGMAVVATAAIAAAYRGVPFSLFTRDVSEIADLPYYAGFLSNLGYALWAAAGAVCLFTASLLKADSRRRAYYGAAAALSIWLMLDDLGTMHEIVLPQYVGVSEKAIFGGYFLLLTAFLVTFRREILQSNFVVLAAACGLAAFSVAVDAVPKGILSGHHVLEDGAKFLAISGWTGYFVASAYRDVRRLHPAE